MYATTLYIAHPESLTFKRSINLYIEPYEGLWFDADGILPTNKNSTLALRVVRVKAHGTHAHYDVVCELHLNWVLNNSPVRTDFFDENRLAAMQNQGWQESELDFSALFKK